MSVISSAAGAGGAEATAARGKPSKDSSPTEVSVATVANDSSALAGAAFLVRSLLKPKACRSCRNEKSQ